MGDPVFKGMTRPAMMWGVTYSGLIINAMICIVLFIGLNNVLLMFIAIPVHLLMFVICEWEERFFDLAIIHFKTKGGDARRYLYNASSYRP